MKVLRLFVLFWVMALTHYAKATNAHVEGLVYKINEKAKTAIVIACEKTGYVTIPESISFLGDEYVVKAIGDEAFAHNRQIEGVTIPGTIETIKNSAFSFCKELKVVDIKYGVKKIGNDVFWKCEKLNKVNLPASLTKIGSGAFRFCLSLKEIIVPASVTSIGNFAFWGCDKLDSAINPTKIKKSSLQYIFDERFICEQRDILPNQYDVSNNQTLAKADEKTDYPALEVISNTLEFIDERGYNTIEGGYEYAIRFAVANKGRANAKGCKLKVTAKGNTNGLVFKDQDLKTINSGKTLVVEVPIKANMNTENGEVEFALEISEPHDLGPEIQYISIKTKEFNRPLIKITDYTVSSSIGATLKKKEPFDLQLMLQNTESGKADDVSVRLELPDNVILLDGDDRFVLNTLDGGESKSLEYSLIVNNDYVGNTIPVKVHIEERYKKYAEDRIINLSLDQSLASSKLKVEETKKMPQKEITIAHLGSDVDKNIPQASDTQPKTFVVIIANENYQRVESVPFASNDGNSFANYCREALGIPSSNIKVSINATLNDLKYQIDWLKQVMDVYAGEARAIFYYAGHGVPDEHDKSAYLLPVDGYAENTSTGYSLEALYNALGALPARSIMVFLDACFSGTRRDGKMLLSARGVAIKAKKTAPKGNMVVYSATQGDETAYPYQSQQHGMFTYYILKKIQQSKGKLSMGELTDYVTQEVKRQSIVTNGKLQTPTISLSDSERENWRNLMLK